MKNDQLIENILKESQSDLDVGKVLFGSDSKVAKLQNKEQEEDTSPEAMYFKYIKDYIEGATSNNKIKLKSISSQLQQLKSKFPKVLTPLKDLVYRGTSVKTDMLISLIKEHGYIATKFRDWFLLKTTIDYTSLSTLTSWTYNFDIAQEFTNSSERNKTSSIIIETTPDNSFILSPKFSNLIAQHVGLSKEFETIAMKSDFNNCRAYFHEMTLENLK